MSTLFFERYKSLVEFYTQITGNPSKSIEQVGPLSKPTAKQYIDPVALRKNQLDKEKKQKDEVIGQIKDTVSKLKNHPILSDIKKFENNPRMLAHTLSAFVSLVEGKTPKLRHDQPGWDGNSLRLLTDNEKAPQFICTDEACFAIEMMGELQKQKLLSEYEIKPVETFAHGSHTAVGIFTKESKEPLIILDPWVSKPGSGAAVFITDSNGSTAIKTWESNLKTFSQAEQKEADTFRNKFKYKDDRLPGISNDYQIYKFSKDPDLMLAILPGTFTSFRDRMIYFLDKDGYWNESKNKEEEKQNYATLSIKEKSDKEIKEEWKKLEPLMKVYFERLYNTKYE